MIISSRNGLQQIYGDDGNHLPVHPVAYPLCLKKGRKIGYIMRSPDKVLLTAPYRFLHSAGRNNRP
ncbi:MAG: hypothetical protein VR69_16695 [Peptococcaceae bacterium BRH_c4b]|nr:MAG: hypothetical protein VR69_16695 [Peptococcaceae bacterium BRH_c4b]